ncbi:protein rolling stone-like [Branchiostoma floridae]|uniref:Protein rolling stone-like n=1 Tax=Branchiostoma floridae TaxID=7739 RepID=A0A9J7KH04_BRAFL|nr:protein rolling stone-like [Branchiostoma floridae]
MLYPQGATMFRLLTSFVRLFSLEHHDRAAFYTSPVLKNQAIFVLYRVLAAGVWGSFNVWSLLNALLNQNWLWFARLTHWTMILLTAHLVFSAVLAWKHLCEKKHNKKPVPQDTAQDDNMSSSRELKTSEDNGSKLTCCNKTSWVLFNLASASSFCVTSLYVTLIATPRHFVGVMEHIINSVIVVVDIVVNGIPVKVHHFVYPSLVGTAYAVFSMIYWALGGLGKNGETFLYPPLKYEKEHRARTLCFIAVCLVFVLPLLQALCCALRHLRSRLIVGLAPNVGILQFSPEKEANNQCSYMHV